MNSYGLRERNRQIERGKPGGSTLSLKIYIYIFRLDLSIDSLDRVSLGAEGEVTPCREQEQRVQGYNVEQHVQGYNV